MNAGEWKDRIESASMRRNDGKQQRQGRKPNRGLGEEPGGGETYVLISRLKLSEKSPFTLSLDETK